MKQSNKVSADLYSEDLSEKYTKQRDQFNASDDKAFEFLNRVGIKGKDMLDLGCGDGRYSCQFMQMGANSVKGIDISSAMIERAQLRKCGAEFIEGDCASLPYNDASFDVVFSNFVLQHCKDVATPIREVSRTLRGGGYLIATFNTVITDNEAVLNKEMPIMLGVENPVVVHDLAKTDKEFEAAISEAGLVMLEYTDEPNDYIAIDPNFPYISDIKKLKTIVCLCRKLS